eukprot:CAMPEP_0174379760 /NCGR_PEP_ID=MMETSP0811_2-20130205/122918_1 /TAXON_ID=73025 ORGANISM="Eutreptiella gymnastica-like, Strain CCMP1594" /NCGR_SAMPLE_ID=MMETSP0811_2 /ASSEMBLY_ACC=CAM_ASM_000667 /LENGTH=73 /DNA_ID=CAMNT_0015532387 /DNA_START=55 /DNA_END=276 /DNA_ORIENTATION=+
MRVRVASPGSPWQPDIGIVCQRQPLQDALQGDVKKLYVHANRSKLVENQKGHVGNGLEESPEGEQVNAQGPVS